MNATLTTLFAEVVNFTILVLVLHRLVYRPLRNAIAERRRAIDEDRESVSREKESMAAVRDELETSQRQLDDLRADVRREAVEEALEERTRILEQAREDAAGERARVQALLDSERKAADEWVRSTAVEEATHIAGRLLQQLAPKAVEGALREGLIDAIARNAERLREQIRDGTAEAEVTGATLPTDEVVHGVRDALEMALGTRPRLAVREDERLEAGLVLRVEDVVLDASLGGQLSAYRDLAASLADT